MLYVLLFQLLISSFVGFNVLILSWVAPIEHSYVRVRKPRKSKSRSHQKAIALD